MGVLNAHMDMPEALWVGWELSSPSAVCLLCWWLKNICSESQWRKMLQNWENKFLLRRWQRCEIHHHLHYHHHHHQGEVLSKERYQDQRVWGCLIPETVQGQVELAAEQSGSAKRVPAHGSGLEWDDIKAPSQLKPFYDSKIESGPMTYSSMKERRSKSLKVKS